ncbi:TPA: PASTA domain-containing protein [Candidatus Poribacteria bacterium]|nr:PASTA domain-containing protein [Candidatus Poribacteria bacterium]HEX28672.1 PASTA domain-containing protein [Candidatus Poribacteria bacterium]
MSEEALVKAVKISLISLVLILFVGMIFVFIILPRQIRGKVVEVPNVVGRRAEEAERKLIGLRLRPVVETRRFSNTVPENHIIAQSPQAGMKVKLGGKVNLVVSLGRDKVTVPDLTGKMIDEAESMLGEVGLRVGVRSRVYSEKPSGIIIAQNPPPKSVAARGDPVDLLISDGIYPEPLIMNDLRGMKLEKAEEAIRNSGLSIGEVSFQQAKEREAETIISQNPSPGSPIKAGDKVDLVVSVPQVKKRLSSRPVVIRHIVNPNAEGEVHVRIVVEHQRGIERLVDGYFSPSEKIERLAFVVGKAMVRIYEDDMEKPVKEEVLR